MDAAISFLMDSIPLISNFGARKHTELMDKHAIFPLFYLPSIHYFSLLANATTPVLLEDHEHFPKQTYRNRASISSPNGKLDLIVPVVKGSKVHTRMRDVRISYDFNWQRQHWMSLQTSYRSSSWFEFYEDELAPCYEKKVEFLLDFNEELLQVLIKLLKIKVTYTYTGEYRDPAGEPLDYRASLHPKTGISFPVQPYFQLFADRNGFLPNLSIVDLLFSQGPRSPEFL